LEIQLLTERHSITQQRAIEDHVSLPAAASGRPCASCEESRRQLSETERKLRECVTQMGIAEQTIAELQTQLQAAHEAHNTQAAQSCEVLEQVRETKGGVCLRRGGLV
jgi:hypothetical protein